MNPRIITIIIFILVILAAIYAFTGDVYQGPVPEGYDEPHFRRTGETIPL